MASSKPSVIFLILLLLIVTDESVSAEARALQLMPNQENYSKLLPTLGVVCKCCDGRKEDGCTTTWQGSCNKLKCVPWKYDD